MIGHPESSQEILTRYNQELDAVNDLAEAITLGQGADAVMAAALNRTIKLMDVDVGAIYLLDAPGKTLNRKASQGLIPESLESMITTSGSMEYLFQGLLDTGRAIAADEPLALSQLPAELAHLLAQEGFVSWACAPLKMEGEVIGIYFLGKRSSRSFSIHDLALLEIIGNVVGTSLSNAQLLVDLRHKETELRRALHRSVDLQEEERKRLARELHDEIGQALTSILIRLRTLSEEKDLAVMKERMNDLRNLTAQTIEELRRLAMDLRPAALDNLGIVPALRWYVQQCAERTGLEIQFLEPEKLDRLAPEAELTLYRVAQEGLTNAIRHGRAKKIVLLLERDLNQQKIRLTISDNGVGFNSAALDRGLGLVGIRERVELLDGDLSIDTDPSSGTQLSVEIPIKR